MSLTPLERADAALGDPYGDFRERKARERLEAEERRQYQLTEQASLLNDPPARVRAWERAHGLALPRAAGHPVLARIAAATQLSLEEIRAEQVRRATRSQPTTVPHVAPVGDSPASA